MVERMKAPVAPKAAPAGKTPVNTCTEEVTGWIMDILSPVPDALYENGPSKKN